MIDESYEQWLKCRRAFSASDCFSDQVMSCVADAEQQRESTWWLGWIQHIDKHPVIGVAACCAALFVGGFPFLLLAHVAKFLTF